MNKNWTSVKTDLNATVKYGIELIEQAAKNNARLIAFPEVWFPGYPKGIINGESPNPRFSYHVDDYIENSLVLGSPQWESLVAAAKDNQIYVALSYSEKDDSKLYMAQALLSPEGELLIHRHKLRPSASERDLWSDGTPDMIRAVNTPIGRIGLLSCGEHTAPEATFLMQAQTEDIHVGSWLIPDIGQTGIAGYESAEVILSLAKVYAVLSGAYVVQSAIGMGTIFEAGSSQDWSQVKASVSYKDEPIVYRSVNSTAFNKRSYDSNGEVSWATLQEINKALPSYIPHEAGNYVQQRSQTIEELETLSLV